MRKLNLLLIGFLLSFFIMSCSTPKQVVQVVRVVEKERTVNKSFDAIWLTTVEWFATHNTPIKNLDKASGLISTEYSLSMGDAAQYMDCPNVSTRFLMGKVELVNHAGNFNVLLKKIDENTTKVSVNVFYGCTENQYRTAGLLSSGYIFDSSTKLTCSSTGRMEKEILDYIMSR